MIGGSLFSGYGGLDLALEQTLGVDFAWHVENDPHASTVLAHRWPDIPNHGDITSVDWSKVEPVDLLCGGFPCQDVSSAGLGAGIKEGTRSGLWYRFADAIRVLRPRLVVVENVSALLVRGLDVVTASLAEIGYVGSWLCLRASDVGACHPRDRLFIVAWPADAADLGCERIGGARLGWSGPADGGGQPPDLNLLPTPSAANPNDGEDLEGWAARRQRVKATSDAGNGFGMPLSIAVRLLPTPKATNNENRSSDWANGPNLGEAVRLLPTPTTEPATGNGHARNLAAEVDAQRWGQYARAIARHEAVFGVPAPDPRDDSGKLSARFVEWMMMLPAGWVTDLLGRGPAIKRLGNGVVPAQASAAVSLLLDRAFSEAAP